MIIFFFREPATDLQDSNISVTITLTSSAADNILSVLTELANLLRIAPPSAYKIVENTNSMLNQITDHLENQSKMMGDDKNIFDVQKILNGCGKFCNSCDILIMKDAIRIEDPEYAITKKFFLKNIQFLYFCSKLCYTQYQSSLNTSFNRHEIDVKMSVSMDSENIDFKMNKDMLNKTLDLDQSNPTDFINYKYFQKNSQSFHPKCRKMTEKEIVEMLFKLNITVKPKTKMADDTRQCILCSIVGDGIADGCSRLLNLDVNKWVILFCAFLKYRQL